MSKYSVSYSDLNGIPGDHTYCTCKHYSCGYLKKKLLMIKKIISHKVNFFLEKKRDS
jgi:hypothetical protein